MRLETKRLVLREWRKDDIDDLGEGLNNLEISKWMAFVPYPYTKKDAQNWIKHCKNTARKQQNYCFAIELKSEKKSRRRHKPRKDKQISGDSWRRHLDKCKVSWAWIRNRGLWRTNKVCIPKIKIKEAGER